MIILTIILLSQSNGDTLRWYDPDSTTWGSIGLIGGPTCHWAIKFVVDPSLAGRVIHSGRFHTFNLEDSLLIMRLCKGTATSPGIVLDSAIFPTFEGFNEAFFGDTIVLNQGDTIWLWCYQYRKPGYWPGSVDSGPAVVSYGDLISLDGTFWLDLSDVGIESNWVMELILTPLDVEEGPAKPEEKLTLLPASSGFWIAGYSGLAQIYDPAGRLVLSKEIRGKTLISPLRPGVYFVVAGKERAKAAVQ